MLTERELLLPFTGTSRQGAFEDVSARGTSTPNLFGRTREIVRLPLSSWLQPGSCFPMQHDSSWKYVFGLASNMES